VAQPSGQTYTPSTNAGPAPMSSDSLAGEGAIEQPQVTDDFAAFDATPAEATETADPAPADDFGFGGAPAGDDLGAAFGGDDMGFGAAPEADPAAADPLAAGDLGGFGDAAPADANGVISLGAPVDAPTDDGLFGGDAVAAPAAPPPAEPEFNFLRDLEEKERAQRAERLDSERERKVASKAAATEWLDKFMEERKAKLDARHKSNRDAMATEETLMETAQHESNFWEGVLGLVPKDRKSSVNGADVGRMRGLLASARQAQLPVN